MTTGYDAPIGYDSDINYDGGPSVVTSLQLPTWSLDILNPLTGAKSPLPEAKIDQMSFEDSAVSAISFTVASGTVGASLCNDLAIVSLKSNGVDVKDGRWLLRGAGWNEGTVAQFKQFTGRHLLWDRLEHTVIQPGPRKLFVGKTPGYILNDLFLEAQARDVGFFDTFTWTFTATTDSNGRGWPTALGSLEYLPTAKYSDIVSNLVDKGVIDISLKGNEIRLTVPETEGAITQALLVVGKDVNDAPQQSSSDNLVSDVVMLGDDGVTVVRANTETRATYWREEAGISQGGTKDIGTLSIFGDVALSSGAAPRVQRTYGLVVTQDRPFLPLRDYAVGDWVRAQHATGQAQSLRVKQIVIKREKGYYGGTLVLNDKFLENELRLTKKVDGIIGGATITGSSQTSTPDDEKDNTYPKPPTAVSGVSTSYVDNNGNTQALAIFSWAAPTQNTDNSVITDLSHYQVIWKYADQGDSVPWQWRYTDGPELSANISPLEPGRDLLFFVRAIDTTGHWSTGQPSPYVLTLGQDTTPPPAPSGPLLTSVLKTFVVEWNGLTAAGAQMPKDFHHVEVWSSKINNFNVDLEGTYHGTLLSAGQLYVTGYGYAVGTTVYFKFVAVDNSGNRSTPSAGNSNVLAGVSGPDITAGSITANSLAVGSVTAQAILAGAITADKISLGQTNNLVADPSFNSADWRARRLTTEWAENPARWAFKGPGQNNWDLVKRNGWYLQALSQADGVNGGRMYICDWISCQLGETYYAGIYLRNGEFAPNASATVRLGVEVTKADGAIESDGISYAPDFTWTKCGYRFIIQNPDWVRVRFFVRADDITSGDIAMDDWEVRSGVGTTEYAGSRGLLDNIGLFAWDSADNNTFTLDFRSGEFIAKGSIQSGFQGKRTIINPSTTLLPEIRFYPEQGGDFAYINATGTESFPFIGVNAPDDPVTGISSALILFDTLTVLGAIKKSNNEVQTGIRISGLTKATGDLRIYGKLPWSSESHILFSGGRWNTGTPTTGAASHVAVLGKPSAPDSGLWMLMATAQWNSSEKFTWHPTGETATQVTIIFSPNAATWVTGSPPAMLLNFMWVRADTV